MSLTKTPIQWTWDMDAEGILIPLSGATWNPLVGCRRVSRGCERCYAERLLATRLSKHRVYKGLSRMTRRGPQFTGKHALVAERLDAPLRARQGLKIFVCDLGDLFFEAHSFEEIAAVFGIMAAAHWHVFQVLTKRPKRMLEFFAWLLAGAKAATASGGNVEWAMLRALRRHAAKAMGVEPAHPYLTTGTIWPLPNVWLGVSTEGQSEAEDRIWRLLNCPAPVHFLSVEPQVEAIDPTALKVAGDPDRTWNCLVPSVSPDALSLGGALAPGRRVDWVIEGGESGPGARPFQVVWMRDMRDACKKHGVALFPKQVGKAPLDPGALCLKDSHGGDEKEWPEDLRGLRRFPDAPVMPSIRPPLGGLRAVRRAA